MVPYENIFIHSKKWPQAVRANGHLLLNSEKVRQKDLEKQKPFCCSVRFPIWLMPVAKHYKAKKLTNIWYCKKLNYLMLLICVCSLIDLNTDGLTSLSML